MDSLFTTLIRWQFFRKLTLSNYRTDLVNGPSRADGELEPVLTMILRAGRNVKNLSETRLTGCIQHTNPFLCPVLATFMHLCQRLRGKILDFERTVGTVCGDWMNVYMSENLSYKTMYNNMADVLKDLGYEWAKVTHIKRLGMDFLSKRIGPEGLEEIAALSKHGNEKNRYFTELPPRVLLLMAGFELGNDIYEVPRTALQLGPYTESSIVKCFSRAWMIGKQTLRERGIELRRHEIF